MHGLLVSIIKIKIFRSVDGTIIIFWYMQNGPFILQVKVWCTYFLLLGHHYLIFTGLNLKCNINKSSLLNFYGLELKM